MDWGTQREQSRVRPAFFIPGISEYVSWADAGASGGQACCRAAGLYTAAMKAGISPDVWTRWLREPIAQGLLLSFALHLAIAVVFQPVPGASGRHTLVINARLQPAVSQSEVTPAVSEDPQEDPAEVVVEAKSTPSADLLTATTPSPAPPIPQSAAPASNPSPTPAPMPAPMPLPAPVAAVAPPADVQSSTDKSRGLSQATGLPSLPIGIDTTWYLARQVDHHPKAIGLIEPAYPEEARRRNLEGTLKLMLKIDDLGRVQSAEVVEATPPGVFDEVALAAFRAAHFRPAMKDGRPVRYQAYMRVEFKLRD